MCNWPDKAPCNILAESKSEGTERICVESASGQQQSLGLAKLIFDDLNQDTHPDLESGGPRIKPQTPREQLARIVQTLTAKAQDLARASVTAASYFDSRRRED